MNPEDMMKQEQEPQADPTATPEGEGGEPGSEIGANGPTPDILSHFRGLIDGAAERSKRQEVEHAMSDRVVEQMRQEVLKDVLDSLTKAGVDVNDPAAVQQFVDSLKQKDPNLAALFETAFGILSPGGLVSPAEPTGMDEPVPGTEGAEQVEPEPPAEEGTEPDISMNPEQDDSGQAGILPEGA